MLFMNLMSGESRSADLGTERGEDLFRAKVIDAAESTKVWYAISVGACRGENYV